MTMLTLLALTAVLAVGIILGRAWQYRIDQRSHWLTPRKIEHQTRNVMDGIRAETRQAEARMWQVAFRDPHDRSGRWSR